MYWQKEQGSNKYQKLINFISQQYFEEQNKADNQFLLDIGRDHLKTLAKKIIYFELSKQSDRAEDISENIDRIIIKQIGVSDQKHLGMCIGKAFKQKNYQTLNEIEPDIKKCIKNFIQNPYALQVQKKSNKLFKSDSQIRKSNTRVQSTQSDNKQSYNRKSSFWKSQSEIKSQLTLNNYTKEFTSSNKKQNQIEKKHKLLSISNDDDDDDDDDEKMEELSLILPLKMYQESDQDEEDKILLELMREKSQIIIKNQNQSKIQIQGLFANNVSMQQLSSIIEQKGKNIEESQEQEEKVNLANLLKEFKIKNYVQQNQYEHFNASVNDQSMQQLYQQLEKANLDFSLNEDEYKYGDEYEDEI